jgi:hypothetical protein
VVVIPVCNLHALPCSEIRSRPLGPFLMTDRSGDRREHAAAVSFGPSSESSYAALTDGSGPV